MLENTRGAQMLFDTHSHYNNESFTKEKRKALFEETSQSEVKFVVDCAFDLESAQIAVKHSEEYDFCYATAGYHPHNADQVDDMTLFLIEGLAKKERVVAIGEIGLDFYRNLSPEDIQIEAFRKQIRLANKLKMPIVIHSRDADRLVMDILREEGAFSTERKSWFPKRKGSDGTEVDDARVLLHCFSGSKELAWEYVRQGATISIAGPVTYKNNKKTRAVVGEIPIEFLTIETDSPYLTPEPYRGKENKPMNVRLVAEKIAEIKDISYEEVARTTCENGVKFFNIKG